MGNSTDLVPPEGEVLLSTHAPRPPSRNARIADLRASSATKRSTGRTTHRWSRLIHVYTSMVALIAVLFFAGTGILMNHPSWVFGTETEVENVSGQFPFAVQPVGESGAVQGVDFLSVSEYVREHYDVVGTVDYFGTTGQEASIAYRNPGYAADLFFDIDDATFDLRIERQGWVAAVSDLHQGSSTGSAWKWVIDIAAAFLIVISLTGLAMQFFLKKRRRSAYVVAAVGTAITVTLMANALM